MYLGNSMPQDPVAWNYKGDQKQHWGPTLDPYLLISKQIWSSREMLNILKNSGLKFSPS